MNKAYIIAGILAVSAAVGGTAYAAEVELGRQGGIGGRGERGALEAQLLGITVDEFRQRVQNGESPRDMLEASGVTRDDMEAAREVRMRENLAKKVADGTITQAEADARSTTMHAHRQKHEAVRVALENGDYTAFTSAVQGTPLATEVTAENFARFKEAHTLMEAGDHDAARAIMDELGIKRPHQKAQHKGPGMKLNS